MDNQYGIHVLSEIEGGFFLVARKIVYSSLNFTRPEDFKLAILLLALANWKDGKWYDEREKREITIKRGQHLTSRAKLSEVTRLSQKTVRTSLNRLKRAGFLAKVSGRGYTLITVCKYERYQNIAAYTGQETGQGLGQPLANHWPTTGQPPATIETGKHGNQDKHENKDLRKGEEENEKFSSFSQTNPHSTEMLVLSPLAKIWNDTVGKHLSRVMFENQWRKKKASERLAEHTDLEWWRNVIRRILKSSFMMGQTERSKWRANFNWLIRDSGQAFLVLEGQYDDPIDPNVPPPPRDITFEKDEPPVPETGEDISDEEHRRKLNEILTRPSSVKKYEPITPKIEGPLPF